MDNYFDTHIHLDYLDGQQTQLEEAGLAGVGSWVVPGTSCQRWSDMMATTGLHPNVYVAPGIHPQFADQLSDSRMDELRRLLSHPRAVAIGEVGLDRQVACPWHTQEAVFIRMIGLARDTGKPLLIHARRSIGRVIELLRREGAEQVGGIFHAFSGSLESAREIIALNFAIGVSGVVTLGTARRLPEVIGKLPSAALVLETDAPDLPPEPYRGQANRAAYLSLVAERVATLRRWSLAETARITTANARRIFKLPPEAGALEPRERP